MLNTGSRFWLLFAIAAGLTAQTPGADGTELFETKIRPILATRCYPCHSASSPKVQGGLWLDSRDGLRKGGNSGPPIVEGDPDSSLLIKALRHTDSALKMPPGKPLKPEIIASFEQWVRLGAPDPRSAVASKTRDPISAKSRDFWSFHKPVMPPVPAVSDTKNDTKWAKTPVDHFILAKLEHAKLTPSPEADKRTLLRRATYDLTGLPPSQQEIGAYLRDQSPNAFEKVVDRLLTSPAYGERWGRHWMDVARYADTSDGGARFAFSYTYRDWVIRALNDDMPYNEFVMKQVAADQMDLTNRADLAALGFITLGRSVPKGEHDMIDDRIDVLTRGLQGLTVTCARCHDHKFDPIPTRDYYSFYGMVANSREPVEYPLLGKADSHSDLVRRYDEGMQRRLKAIDDFKIKRHAELVAEYRTATWISRYMLAAQQAAKMSNTEIEKLSQDRDYNLFVLRRWRDYLNRTTKSGDGVFLAWNALAAIAETDFASKAEQTLRALPQAANSEITKALLAKLPSSLDDAATTYGEVLAKLDSPTPHRDPAAEAIRLALRGDDAPANVALSDFMKIRGAGGDDNIIRGLTNAVRVWQAQCGYRGLPPRAMALEDSPEPKLAHVFVRGNPNNLGVEAPPQFLTVLSEQPVKFTEGSGRLGLAKAIANRDNPLTARVIVNRVWQWHFGRGIVGTPSDFGTRGDAPTHPELLDYLATRFMDEGWSLKKLHRWIMLSKTYRQSSLDRPDAHNIDPENKLVWRMNRQRLDYESLRDSALFVAGRLEPSNGGLPFSLTAFPSVPRRTVYAYVQRGRLPGELNSFDFANPESHVPQRFQTTVPQQALYLMNSPFIAEQAKHVSERPDIRKSPAGPRRVEALYRVVLGRDPDPTETALALDYVKQEPQETATAPPSSPWAYGLTRNSEFTAFKYFTEEKWEPASIAPQPVFGSASLSAKGGTAPDDPGYSVTRRWVSPIDGIVEITGTLKHKLPKEESWGDGVHARIVHNRKQTLADAVVKNTKKDFVAEVRVSKGDTIDFAVDSISDPENDDFTWAPVIKVKSGDVVWDAAKEFSGPPPVTLNAWDKLAQVLLEMNEFAFVD